MIHLLLHGHWPRWFRADYDGLTWRYRCAVCEPHHRDTEQSEPVGPIHGLDNTTNWPLDTEQP